MGPFPHDAPQQPISATNPAGTNGMEFVEFAHDDPSRLRDTFGKMGFVNTAKHKTRNIELWQQGDITYVINAEPGSMAMNFAALHGPCAPSMAWRVVDANKAYAHAVSKGAKGYTGRDKTLDVPAIYGIGDSLIYFIDTYGNIGSPYADEFDFFNTTCFSVH